ncbi:MAG: hypothetical protein LBP98_02895 [Tannerella sp.]|jgi:hypothetical protein|nr:hypothetical protein [Tannerella sp.]
MKKKKIDLRFGIIGVVILLAAVSRLIPHPVGFVPIAGMALFGAAYYSKRYWAYIVPIVAMMLSDIILNTLVYSAYMDRQWMWIFLYTYGALALIVLMGTFTLKSVRVPEVAISAVGASVIFYLVTNFGTWISSGMYPHTWEGLTACYTAALPFFRNGLAGDLLYTGILFGAFELLMYKFPSLKAQKAAA